MPQKYFVQIGRVALIHHGRNAGKICTIVDVIDQNRALVDGPCSGVTRQPISFKLLRLTRFRLRMPHGASSKLVKETWDKAEINKLFANTTVAKRIVAAEKRKNLTDFDRFKIYKTKQRINKMVKAKFERLRAKANRELKAKLPVKSTVEKPKKKKTVKKVEKK